VEQCITKHSKNKYSLFFSKEDFFARILGYFFLLTNWYFRGEGFLLRKKGENIEFRELKREEYIPSGTAIIDDNFFKKISRKC